MTTYIFFTTKYGLGIGTLAESMEWAWVFPWRLHFPEKHICPHCFLCCIYFQLVQYFITAHHPVPKTVAAIIKHPWIIKVYSIFYRDKSLPWKSVKFSILPVTSLSSLKQLWHLKLNYAFLFYKLLFWICWHFVEWQVTASNNPLMRCYKIENKYKSSVVSTERWPFFNNQWDNQCFSK